MATSWSDASEITLGLILQKRLALNSVRAELFQSPYKEIVREMEKNPAIAIEDLIATMGLSPIQSALDAANSVNGLGKSDWAKILETSYTSYSVGGKLEKLGRKLQTGESADLSVLAELSQHMQMGTGEHIRRLSEITAQEMPKIKTGFVAMDKHFGGIPEIGLILLAAPPKTGKSWTMANLATCFIREHKDKNVMIFTIEMIAEELKLRFSKSKLTKEEEDRIFVDDGILTPEEIISRASTIGNLGIVMVDFADLLIQGETTESSTAHIYRTFMTGAKKLHCPILLLAQLSRKYTGGIPRPHHIRWSGLAEALAWAIFMIYNPNQDWFAEDTTSELLPPVKNRSYLIGWAIRGGFPEIHKDDSPGAVSIPFKGTVGWKTTDEGRWFSLSKL